MKAFQKYLNYLDAYFYNEETESLDIRFRPEAQEAMAFHQTVIGQFGLDREDRWILEIALDALRQLPQRDRDFMAVHMNDSDYHFDLGLWIRNTYIHPSRKYGRLMADSVSSAAIRFIFTILSPVYDYRNRELCSFYEDCEFRALPDSFEEVWQKERDAAARELLEKSLPAGEALSLLKERIRTALGEDGFARLLREIYLSIRKDKDFENCRDYADLERRLDDLKELYPLEVNQFIALNSLGFPDRVTNTHYASEDECRQAILDSLGLQEAYAASMARALFLACHAARCGILEELPVSAFDLDYDTCCQLERRGLRYVGDVRACGEEKLRQLDCLTQEDLALIRQRLDYWDCLSNMP